MKYVMFVDDSKFKMLNVIKHIYEWLIQTTMAKSCLSYFSAFVQKLQNTWKLLKQEQLRVVKHIQF